jgi:hypothetical protein
VVFILARTPASPSPTCDLARAPDRRRPGCRDAPGGAEQDRHHVGHAQHAGPDRRADRAAAQPRRPSCSACARTRCCRCRRRRACRPRSTRRWLLPRAACRGSRRCWAKACLASAGHPAAGGGRQHRTLRAEASAHPQRAPARPVRADDRAAGPARQEHVRHQATCARASRQEQREFDATCARSTPCARCRASCCARCSRCSAARALKAEMASSPG